MSTAWPALSVATNCSIRQQAARYVHGPVVSFTDATIAHLPRVTLPYAEWHHELIKLAIVDVTTFFIDSTLFYTLS